MDDKKFIQKILDTIGEFGDGLLEFETKDIERLCNLAINKNSSLPDNWEDKLYDEYGFGITVNENWLKGYNQDGKFYYSQDDMKFLNAVFNELLKRGENNN